MGLARRFKIQNLKKHLNKFRSLCNGSHDEIFRHAQFINGRKKSSAANAKSTLTSYSLYAANELIYRKIPKISPLENKPIDTWLYCSPIVLAWKMAFEWEESQGLFSGFYGIYMFIYLFLSDHLVKYNMKVNWRNTF